MLHKTEVEIVTEEELERLTSKLLYPYQIFKNELYRIRVFLCGKKVYLYVDMSHVISDGTSLGILLDDISRTYWGKEPVKDYYYTYLMKECENAGKKEAQEVNRYYEELLGDREWCSMPTPDHESWVSEVGDRVIPGVLSVKSMEEAEERLGVSRNIIAISATMLALHEYCGKDFIKVRYVSSNRTEEYLYDTVGSILQMFPVAINVNDYPSTDRFLNEVNRQVAENLWHGYYSFGPEYITRFDGSVMVNYISDIGDASVLKGFNPTPIPLSTEYATTVRGCMMYIAEVNGEVNLNFTYERNTFEDSSIDRFLDVYVKMLKRIVEHG